MSNGGQASVYRPHRPTCSRSASVASANSEKARGSKEKFHPEANSTRTLPFSYRADFASGSVTPRFSASRICLSNSASLILLIAVFIYKFSAIRSKDAHYCQSPDPLHAEYLVSTYRDSLSRADQSYERRE